MSDHRENIIEYADWLSNDVRACVDRDEDDPDPETCDITERFLDVAVFRRVGMPEVYRVEFLITCGGPTVRVTVDDDGSVELFHSWGMDKDGGDRRTASFRSADEELWRSLAEQFNEMAGDE